MYKFVETEEMPITDIVTRHLDDILAISFGASTGVVAFVHSAQFAFLDTWWGSVLKFAFVTASGGFFGLLGKKIFELVYAVCSRAWVICLDQIRLWHRNRNKKK